jgi:hypothetical protein
MLSKSTISKFWFIFSIFGIIIFGCKQKGVAQFDISSCKDGLIHYKTVVDTSYFWRNLISDIRIEPANQNPFHYINHPDLYYWGSLSDTTLWVEFTPDSVVEFDHLHLDSAFERFYAHGFYKNQIITYSISQKMRKLAMIHIREIQQSAPDSTRKFEPEKYLYSEYPCK